MTIYYTKVFLITIFFFIYRGVCLHTALSFVTKYYDNGFCGTFYGLNVNNLFQEGKLMHCNFNTLYNKRHLRDISYFQYPNFLSYINLFCKNYSLGLLSHVFKVFASVLIGTVCFCKK